MNLPALMIAIAVLAAAAGTAARAEPLDTVLAALAAEERAPVERIRMFIERGGHADVYYIDRVRPGRTHVRKNPRQGGLEMIVIDNLQWIRTDSGWQKSPAPPLPATMPSMAAMFRDGLSAASERREAGGVRTIEGDMAWTNASACKGRLTMRIDRADLPALMRFEGICGGQPTRFRQAFSFEGPLVIEPPLP
jgi:hypothetical protein